MKDRSLLSVVIRGFFLIALVVLLVIAVVAGIGWWKGWTELEDFQRAIQIAGLLVIGLGLMGIKGNLEKSRRFESQNNLSESDQDSWERTQQILRDLAQSYSFLLVMSFAGVVCLMIGWMM